MAAARQRSPRDTITSFPMVLDSASTCNSSPRVPIRRPLSAPACSMALRKTLSNSFSKTISLETACETLTTVARSSTSEDARDRRTSAWQRLVLLKAEGTSGRAALLFLLPPNAHSNNGLRANTNRLFCRSPVHVKGRAAAHKRALRSVQSHSCAEVDGLFIQSLRVQATVFDTGDLCPHQRGTVFEILRAILPPRYRVAVDEAPGSPNAAALWSADTESQDAARQSAV